MGWGQGISKGSFPGTLQNGVFLLTKQSSLDSSVTCASDSLTKDHRCPQPLHWVQLICSQNSGNQLTHLISGLLQRIVKDRRQQPGEEIHSRSSWAKEFLSYWDLGPDTMACRSILVHQSGSSLKLVLLGDFYGVLIKFAWWVKLLAIGDWFNFQSLSSHQKSGSGDENPNLLFGLIPFGNQLLSLSDSKSPFININSAVVERVLLWIMWYPFHLDGSEEISGTKDQIE